MTDFADLAGTLENEMKRNMVKAGLVFISDARKGLNTGQPYRKYSGGKYYRGLNPSAPGAMPHKLTGQLMRSMAFEQDGMTLYLGSNLAGYPAFLETGTGRMAARPWLSLTWDRIGNRVLDIVLGGR